MHLSPAGLGLSLALAALGLGLGACPADGPNGRDGDASADAVEDGAALTDAADDGDTRAPTDDGDLRDAADADVLPAPPAARVLDLDPSGPAIASLALAPDGSRAYLGLALSDDRDRRALWVLDPALGSDVLAATVARDAVDASPLAPGARESVSALALDARRRILYVALTRLDASGAPVVTPIADLAAWSLDDAWEPIGAARVVDSGQAYHAIDALALAPDGQRVYVGGFGEAGVRLVALDGAGMPSAGGELVPFGGYGKRALFVAGPRLFAGTYPGALESVPLAADGRPDPGAEATLDAACWSACELADGYLAPVRVGDALVRVDPEPPPPNELAAAPHGALTLRALAVGAETRALADVRATAAASNGTRLVWARETVFPDAVTGQPTPDGAELVAADLGGDGALGPREVLADAPGRRVVWLAAPTAGPVLALAERRPIAAGRSYPSDLTIEVAPRDLVDAEGHPLATLDELHFEVVGDGRAPTAMTFGVPLAVAGLVRERPGAVLAQVATYAPLDRMHLAVRVRDGDAVLGDWDLDVVGSEVLFFIPGGRAAPAERGALTETFEAHAERYRDAARAAAPDAAPRPRAFPVSCFHLMGGQGSRRALEAEAEAVARLGCNVVTAYAWGRLPPEEIRAALARHGIDGVTGAVYMPPSYFAHDAEQMAEAALDAWADDSIGVDLASTGRRWDEVVDLKIGDEPGWYYPTETDRVAADPALLARFQAWVEALGEPAESYGVASFEELFPATAEARGTSEGNRRYAATMRFFPAQAALGLRLAREALERRAGRPLFVSSNFNNLNVWAWPTPNAPFANNPDAGSRAGYGSLDWLGYARAGAANPWTEDWFADGNAVDWSLPGDYLRRMSELSGRPFGSYLIGAMMGGVPHGPSLKLFALVGRGLRMLDVWTFGPEPLFPGNCWSENLSAYAGLAEALGLLARVEDDVLAARPERGAVALLAPGASLLWDPDYADHRAYLGEPGFLAAALAADNLDLDPLDDVDVAAGALTARGHRVLVVTGPNVAEAAQAEIARWVAAGGTLVLAPSAGVADELARPTARFDALLGVEPRGDDRPHPNPWGFGRNPPLAAALAPTAAGLARGLSARDLIGPVAPLVPSGAGDATVLAVDARGVPLAVERAVGAGRVFGLGFWPGLEHHVARLAAAAPGSILPAPLGDAGLRAWATLGPRAAGVAKRARVDVPGVEALVLESDGALLVVLLDWAGAPLERVTVTVDDGRRRSAARGVVAGPLAVERVGDALVTRAPLDGVEVLRFE